MGDYAAVPQRLPEKIEAGTEISLAVHHRTQGPDGAPVDGWEWTLYVEGERNREIGGGKEAVLNTAFFSGFERCLVTVRGHGFEHDWKFEVVEPKADPKAPAAKGDVELLKRLILDLHETQQSAFSQVLGSVNRLAEALEKSAQKNPTPPKRPAKRKKG